MYVKKCSKCLVGKEVTLFFYADKTKKDGRGSQCKECTLKRQIITLNKHKLPLVDKKCTSCKTLLLIANFSIASYTRTGYSRKCKQCEASLRNSMPVDKKRGVWLKMKYKISLEQYNEKLTSQGGCCAICERSAEIFSKSLCVDHCHSTGKIRGILCNGCNRALGMFSDNSNRFLKAYEYLTLYQ